MGLFRKSSAFFPPYNQGPMDKGDPDPYRFSIVKSYTSKNGKHCALLVYYPDCTNFEGYKILVFKDTTVDYFKGHLDPHFDKSSRLIARFVPTDFGWNLATDFINKL